MYNFTPIRARGLEGLRLVDDAIPLWINTVWRFVPAHVYTMGDLYIFSISFVYTTKLVVQCKGE